jgi:SAM-dependent methyltransferase
MDENNPIEWSNLQAEKLWDGLYDGHDLNLNKRVVLDWGCSWGYFIKYLCDNFKPAMLIGNDISPFWESYEHGWDYRSKKNIKFIAGDLQNSEIPYSGQIDYIFCTSVLQYMRPTQLIANLEKAYSILRPGGEFLGRIRTYGSYIGLDGHKNFNLPYVHLLSSRREMYEFLASKGRKMRYLNYLTPSTYFAIFALLGFEVLDHNRRPNKREIPNTQEVLDKFPWISSDELNCAEIEVRLVRPIEEFELDALSKSDNNIDPTQYQK